MSILAFCRKHPKYQGKRRPRCACEACWYMWAQRMWFACIESSVTDAIKDLGWRVGRN